jgi:hypothetical protein
MVCVSTDCMELVTDKLELTMNVCFYLTEKGCWTITFLQIGYDILYTEQLLKVQIL